MRVWIDVTNSPHVVFFRPLVDLLRGSRARGDDHRAGLRTDARAARGLQASSTPSSGRRTPGRRARARCARCRRACGRSVASPAHGTSTSRSRMPRTSCRSRHVRSAFRRPTRSTTSSRGRSTGSAAGRRRGSSFRRPSPRAASTGSVRGRGRCGATRGSRRSTTSTASRPTRPCSTHCVIDRDRVLAVVRTPTRRLSLPPPRQSALRRCARAARHRPRRPCRRAAAHAGAARDDPRRRLAVPARAGAEQSTP